MKHILIPETQPLVSVIIPAYNAERFIATTLECAVRQTIFHLCEFIIVNDGSTDRTKEVAQHFMCYRNIRIVDKQNGGTGSALNLGHEQARGKFVTWWSADNVYYHNFCEVFAGTLSHAEQQGHGCELMYGDFCYIDQNGRKMQEVVHEKPQGPKDLIEGYDIGMAFMYTKALWDKTGPYWNRICEDYEWVVRAAQHTNFGLLRGIFAGFRVHGQQISGHRQEEEKSAADHCRKLARELHGGEKSQQDDVIMPFANQTVAPSC